MKQFLVILAVTALVWLGLSMSESKDYPLDVRIEMVGYDSVRYAVAQADTLLPITLEMTGFQALVRSLQKEVPSYRVAVDGQRERQALEVATLYGGLRQQLGVRADARIGSQRDSLRLVLAPRHSRSYVPDISNLTFDFAEQYGLYGEPVVAPGKVVLYGPEEALAQIGSVGTKPGKVAGINASATYRLPLEPVWERFPDVHPSCTEVSIYLPVEAYVENEYRVPVTVAGADSSVRYHLYPEEVMVRAWVAKRDLARSPIIRVAIDYADLLEGDGRATPRLVEFPDYIRPRTIDPPEVQCVIIK